MPGSGAAGRTGRERDVDFFTKLEAAAARNQSRLCVGLDPELERIPGADVPAFLCTVIEATADLVCCYKPNFAFFEALGPEAGPRALRTALDAIPPHIPVIADAKRGDIGHTAAAYARAVFDVWNVDAATVNPYGGGDAVEPFLRFADRGVFVWCRSSNPGAADLQDLPVAGPDGEVAPLYEHVARNALTWNGNGNVALVAGATYPAQMARLRSLCPTLLFLLPGVGAQGGDLEASVRAARQADGRGFIVSASRGVLYAGQSGDVAAAARAEAERLRAAINAAQGDPVALR